MIHAIIFDLDSCLASADEVGPQLYEPVFAAIRAANDGSVDETDLAQAFADSWRFPFDEVAQRHRFTPAMRAAGMAAYAEAEVRAPMHGYGDLEVLARLPVRRFLVTTGFARLQHSKIAALGIAPQFEAICVDDIATHAHGTERPGKAGIFRTLVAERGLVPASTLVVGDNPDAEIAAGNALGMVTVQTLRPGVTPSHAAHYSIDTLWQLPSLLQNLEE